MLGKIGISLMVALLAGCSTLYLEGRRIGAGELQLSKGTSTAAGMIDLYLFPITFPLAPPAFLCGILVGLTERPQVNAYRRAREASAATSPESLREFAEDPSHYVRESVARNAATPADILGKLSQDQVDDVRAAVAGNPNTPPEILRSLAGDKAEKIPLALVNNDKLPEDVFQRLVQNPAIAVSLREKLWKRLGDKAIPLCREALQDPAYEIKTAAAEILARIGPPAQTALPELIACLGYEEPHVGWHVRQAAAEAVGAIGPPADAALPGLLAIIRMPPDVIYEDKVSAIAALGKIGANGMTALPLLISCLGEHGSLSATYVRAAAAQTIGNWGPPACAAVPALTDVLRKTDGSWYNDDKIKAIEALGKIGPQARAAIPVLLWLIQTGDFVAEARAALDKIDR